MFSLFLLLVALSVGSFVLTGVLWSTWGIPDVLDELTGNKRKRQIQKLQDASRSIGAGDLAISTTRMMRISDEDDEIEKIISSANVSPATDSLPSGVDDPDFATGSVKPAPTVLNLRIIQEATNLTER